LYDGQDAKTEQDFRSILNSLERMDTREVSLSHEEEEEFSLFRSSGRLHPMAVASRTHFDRILDVTTEGAVTHYKIYFTDFSWFDKSSPNRGNRKDMGPLIAALQKSESGQTGKWMGQGSFTDFRSGVAFLNRKHQETGSSLSLDQVKNIVKHFFSKKSLS
jgi:hypothetical protein